MVIKTKQKIPCGFFLKKDYSIINLLLSKNYNTPLISPRTPNTASLNISQYIKIKHDTRDNPNRTTKIMPPIKIKHSSLCTSYRSRSLINFRRDILIKYQRNDLNITSKDSRGFFSPCFQNTMLNEGMMTNISFRNFQSINKRNRNYMRNESSCIRQISNLSLFQTELLKKKICTK